jgi:hypothetical protein
MQHLGCQGRISELSKGVGDPGVNCLMGAGTDFREVGCWWESISKVDGNKTIFLP